MAPFIPPRAVAALTAAVLALALTATGCGNGDSGADVKAVAAGELGPDPFFTQSLGTDRRGLGPGGAGGVRTGDVAGLYGGTLNKSSCDKAGLIRFLTDPRNAGKARAWAKIHGIDAKDITRYVRPLTPVLLRNDTLVKNHGFRKGAATAFESLLEAGIAVLIDRLGRPVVKCNCGNPLAPPSVRPDQISPDIIGDADWRKRYDPKKTTTVKPGKKPPRKGRFHLTDVVSGKGIGRPAGSDVASDVTLPAPPPLPAPTPTPVPETSTTPPPSPTTAPPPPEIVGTWRAGPSEMRISATGPDTYSGVALKEILSGKNCVTPEGRELWTMSGKGPRFEGLVDTSDYWTCEELSPEQAVWELTDPNSLRMCVTFAQREHCATWARVGA